MPKSSVRVIDQKVSYTTSDQRLRIIILGKIERWKETLLMTWVAAWIFCGIVVFLEWRSAVDEQTQVTYFVFLVFWAYFLWRAGRTMLFRIGGNELIEINQEELVIKKSFFTYGKSKSYFLENIKDFKLIQLSKSSFAYTYEKGWWNLGGEMLSFEYNGRNIKFGMQMTDATTSKVHKLIKKQIKDLLNNSS